MSFLFYGLISAHFKLVLFSLTIFIYFSCLCFLNAFLAKLNCLVAKSCLKGFFVFGFCFCFGHVISEKQCDFKSNETESTRKQRSLCFKHF